ncbi:MAG: CidA/LrgA family protein [Lachnospiraceae bacterium]
MKYVKQMSIIGGITFAGELLKYFLPFPVPASVYGMVLLFLCLCTKLVKEEQIKETADFLLLIMPIMFIDPCVGMIENYGYISDSLWEFVCIVVITTIVIMVVTGLVTQSAIYLQRKKSGNNHEEDKVL